MSCNILSEKTVTTRKPHSCFACFRDFPVGSKLVYQSNIIDGDFGAIYVCETCHTLFKKASDDLYDDFDGIFPEGCVSGALHENGHKTPEDWLKSITI